MLTEKLIASVTTDCLCDPDEDTVNDGICWGECYEWQKEDVFQLLGQWQLVNGIDESDPILIKGSGMTWQRLDGHKWTTMLELDGALALNGDFKIEWYLEGNDLTAKRWSHDEPTGTGLFTFTHFKDCDKCGEPILADVHKEELGMCVDCSNAYFDHSDEE
jgi:hypothetical protein